MEDNRVNRRASSKQSLLPKSNIRAQAFSQRPLLQFALFPNPTQTKEKEERRNSKNDDDDNNKNLYSWHMKMGLKKPVILSKKV